MLSSAKGSVPTVKQFVQPYFIQIAPSGAIAAACERFEELLNDYSMGDYLKINVLNVFSRLGVLYTVPEKGFFDPKYFPASLPPVFDLSLNAADDPARAGNPSLIRWISAPDGENGDGRQLTGIRIGPDGSPADIDPGSKEKKSYLLSAVSENKKFKIFRRTDQRHPAETQEAHPSELVTDLLESITDGFFIMDKNFMVEGWNPEAEKITGLSSAEMVGNNFWDKFPEMAGTDLYQRFHKAVRRRTAATFEQYCEEPDRWLEMSIYPLSRGLFVYFKDITIRKKQEIMLALEKKVLELNSNKKTSLQTIVNFFLKGVEKIFPGMYGSVLTLDEDGLSVRHLSAPRLPAIYSHAIDGLPIGPESGSCGTAMYRKEKVIVSDITTDPLWAGARELAMQFGLRACWSLPIMNAKGDVIGSFAAYYRSPKTPGDMESELLDRAAGLIRVIMENYHAEEAIKISRDRYMLAARATNDAIWDWDLHTGGYFWGEEFYQQFGYKPGSKVKTRKFWEDHLHPDDRGRIIKEMERFVQLKDKGLWLEEYRFKRSDGKWALISDRGFLVFGKEKKILRMIGCMQDITEKREMETRLLKQELNKQKLVARAMVDAQEKERAGIGKELHDNVNQILSTTKLYLELAKNDNKGRMGLIGRSADNIHEAIHEIRNISRSLVPSSISDLGLRDSVNDLVESIRTTSAIHVEFYADDQVDAKIDDKLKLMLFRVIQEQLNNVLKHSAAKNLTIELTLEEGDSSIGLNITDDGKGFIPEKIKNKKGLGLSNIMSRTDLFGGRLTIVSAPGEGCRLRVQVPVL
jgi:PAS domain S-box-containing protein